jgi:putative transposase
MVNFELVESDQRKGEKITMRGPKPTLIELSTRQRANLERIVRKASSKQADVTRARVVLLADEGLNNQQIANRLETHRETARTWRNRWAQATGSLTAAEAEMDAKQFNVFILELLSDQPRSGSPGKFSAEQLCRIVALACEPPEAYDRPVTHWTPKELADEAIKQGIVETISARHAGRFLKQH